MKPRRRDPRAHRYDFARYPGDGKGCVVLIHGWGVRAWSMRALARMLNAEGFTVLNYNYPTYAHHIADHAAIFLERLRAEKLPGKISFVTHSMGGLVLRHALAMMTEAECRAVKSIVMLGPPNHGSALALWGKLELVKLFNRSLGDMAPGSAALDIPAPAYLPPVGIIAGNWDGKVARPSTALPDGLPYDFAVVDCTHPGLRRPVRTGQLIKKFLAEGRF